MLLASSDPSSDPSFDPSSNLIAAAIGFLSLVMLIINFGDRLWKKSKQEKEENCCKFNNEINLEIYQQLLMTASLVKDAAMTLKYQTDVTKERYVGLTEHLKKIEEEMTNMKQDINARLKTIEEDMKPRTRH